MKTPTVEQLPASEKKRGALFAEKLLHWNSYDNHRQMPWKNEKDPYKIWLSEVILQQTRVEQGLQYYRRFVDSYPNINALAAAEPTAIFKLWEGLGYYSRCRNLIATAKFISEELNGIFPNECKDILALKGIGSYTAAAIGSFAYNLPYAVLDGNVFRVLSRIFYRDVPIDTTAGRKEFSFLANAILPPKKAGEYNQAIMDFGATICKPVPLCADCFFSKHCLAYQQGRQSQLPVKEKKVGIRKRWFTYLIIQCGREVVVQQRTGKDIWQGLHQFYLIETGEDKPWEEIQLQFSGQTAVQDFEVLAQWKQKQALTHQLIYFQFLHLHVSSKIKLPGYQWTKLSHLPNLAFPKTLQQVVQHKLGAV